MRIFLLAIIFFLRGSFANAQLAFIDSLKHQLDIAKEDTNKLELLIRLSFNYTWSYADTSFMYAKQALELAQKLNSGPGIAFAQGQMSSALITLGNYPLALDYAFKALQWAEKSGSASDQSYANLGIAMCYREQGDYNSSLAYCRKALAIASTIQSADFDHATVLGVTASVYEKNNQPDSAVAFGKKAYELHDLGSGLRYVLGSAYSKRGSYDSAMFYFRAGLPEAVKNHTEIDLVDIYNGIAIIKQATGDIDSAAWYAKKALTEKVGRTYPLGLLRAANMLVDLYQSQKNDDSTLKYLRISINLKDSLFNRERTMAIQNLEFKEKEKQKELEASKLKYQSRLNIYMLLAGLLILLIVAGGLWRRNIYKQRSYALLHQQKEEIQNALSTLKTTQTQLIQSEKMASLGELTAGIAHEIQNPLNFMNNFSDVNTELIDELKTELATGNIQSANEIADNLKKNEEKINYHGKRADAIVKGMLQHSRSSSGQKELTDINKLTDEYLRLAFHGLRAKDKSFNAKFETNFEENVGKINIIPQDIGRVLLNLINNAFYAVNERTNLQHPGYEPIVLVSTNRKENNIELEIRDNGIGIPRNIVDKIFQPFFTTKPPGQGTGLGLSLAYDIIKACGGEIRVETKEAEYTRFIITLPV